MAELERSGLVITRANGITEQPVFVRSPDGRGSETLVHLAVLPSGHATVIDYDTHPNYKHDPTNAVGAAERVGKFLDMGGDAMLGHPNDHVARNAEVARLRSKHALA